MKSSIFLLIGQLCGLALLPALVAAPSPADKSARPSQPRKAASAPKGGGKLNNPGASMAQRLMQMTPEQQERALEKLPPEQQAQIRQRLERFDALPETQRQRLIQEYQQFASLPPDKQRLVTRQIQALNNLPPDRLPVVRAEVQKLRRMSETARQTRLSSDAFKNKFSPAEQQILADISENMPMPEARPSP